MLFVGIEIAKSHHDVAVLDDNGLVVSRHLRILNSRQGFANTAPIFDSVISRY
ncbi:hypothetical protein ACUIJP_01000 [Leuconostoc pseudomesenteroides]|uniref:hypothetical protein n=1 Tax=Leuconostoc pseudomesenteroides TaxID=33968 RepID=UPI00403D68DA